MNDEETRQTEQPQPVFNMIYPPYDDSEEGIEQPTKDETAMIEVNSNIVLDFLRNCHQYNRLCLERGELTKKEFFAKEESIVGFQIFMEEQFGFSKSTPDGYLIRDDRNIVPSDEL